LQGDELHPIKGIRCIIELGLPKCHQESVSHKFDVLLHQLGVHPDQIHRKRIGDKFFLAIDSITDDSPHSLRGGLVFEHGKEEAGKVAVHPLVTANQFIGEGQSRHQSTLLQPKDGAEAPTEEYTLHCSKGDQTFSKRRVFLRDPPQGPVSLLFHAWDRLNGIEESGLFRRGLDVGVYEEGISLRVYILHRDLKAIKTSGLWDLHFVHKPALQGFH